MTLSEPGEQRERLCLSRRDLHPARFRALEIGLITATLVGLLLDGSIYVDGDAICPANPRRRLRQVDRAGPDHAEPRD